METLWENDFIPSPDAPPKQSGPPTLDAVLDPANVAAAWQRVRRNQGCAGIDGVSIAELEPLFDQQWGQTEAALRSGEYRPQPLLRVRIPKPSGGERLLGIPAVIDRVVEQATAQVLAPRFEPRFSPRSFAYRPGRGPRDALAAVERGLNEGAEYVLHLDIENFFDSVPHPIALAALGNGMTDARLAALVEQTLRSGVYENGLVHPTTVGLAQGSPLSPLLANVVLDRLDRRLEAAGWEFARYADDCVVLLRKQELGSEARNLVVQTLAELGLRLNERKTAFGHFLQARFLGFGFCRDARGQAVRTVSPEALAEAEESLLGFIRSAGGEPQAVASEAAAMLQSWLAYFYTRQDEAALSALAGRVLAAWQERFPQTPPPSCLQWEALRRRAHGGDRVDYSGHFQGSGSAGGPVDWAASARCLLLRLLRSEWWHVEYDLDWSRAPGIRLCFGRHRINLRF